MDYLSALTRGRQKRAEYYASVKYRLDWRSSGEAAFVGLAELKQHLGISQHSIQCYLSRGAGAFTVKRRNPLTEELDLLTVTRIDPPTKEKKPRGRPRTRFPTKEEHALPSSYSRHKS